MCFQNLGTLTDSAIIDKKISTFIKFEIAFSTTIVGFSNYNKSKGTTAIFEKIF
jgi:hypothetical protein